MRGDLVSVDLETTGFNPSQDEIIEIAAVRFRDGVLLDEFQTLVNPARSIPHAVVQLTGIRDEDVVGAPGVREVLPLLAQFAGDAPIVGHNVGFDLGFLNARGILKRNLPLDTYELAAVLLPGAARYNLTALTASFGGDIGTAHRALYDAKATALLYWNLYQQALGLPVAILREIVNAASALAANGTAWMGFPAFEAALAEAQAAQPARPNAPGASVPRAFAVDHRERKPRTLNPQPLAIETGNVAAVFNAGGNLAQVLPKYETRPQQVEMAVRVAEALNKDEHLMIEAGTGTGKSLAYLVPAAQFALQNNTRVVVSTNTINLQDQLLHDDIPALQQALGTPVEAAVLKGRSNYLCPRQWEFARQRPPASLDELRLRAKLLVWLEQTETGDRGELSLRGGLEHALWQAWSADHPGCSLEKCRTAAEGRCPFYKARRAADSAHMLIVNHALLFSDSEAETAILPPYEQVILDEAHHLEDALTSAMTYRLEAYTLIRELENLYDSGRGLLPDLVSAFSQTASPDKAAVLSSFANDLYPVVRLTIRHTETFFKAVYAVAERSNHESQVRMTADKRRTDAFAAAHEAGERLNEYLQSLAEKVLQIAGQLRRSKTFDLARFEPLLDQASRAAAALDTTQGRIHEFMAAPDENAIYWLHTNQERETVSLNIAPLHVGSQLDSALWGEKKSAILTSATLQVRGSFNYLSDRLHGDGVETVELGSPFDYRASTLLYLPTDMPDPSDRNRYQHEVERGIIELAAALGGRTMALFTSYSQLKQTSQSISARLALGNITVLEQADNVNRSALLETFRKSPRAVLLATRSFWEGVDIPGDALSALVIVRLPFAVPSDPIVAARSDTYGDAFNDYSLPDAILRFRQGFGRLIRSASDRGIVTVFDGRVISKGYGMQFIDSLPDCTVEQGTLGNLATRARTWLEKR